MTSAGLPVFEAFIADLRAIWAAEKGGLTRSVASIVRSQRLGQGTVLQRAYDPKGKTVIERFGPTQVPYPLVA
jgi:hypothetical protein